MNMPDFNFRKGNPREKNATEGKCRYSKLIAAIMVEMQGPFCPTTARQSVVNSRAKLHDISEISSLFCGNHRRPPKLFYAVAPDD